LKRNTAAEALAAAGSVEAAKDIAALDASQNSAQEKLAARVGGQMKTSVVERWIFGPLPDRKDLETCFGDSSSREREALVASLMSLMAEGRAFTTDGKLSAELRETVSKGGGYGFTVPNQFGGFGFSYGQLALLEEALAANGFGSLAVEISGQLTIGAGSLLGYGDEVQQKLYLPMVADGCLMGFGLTEVGTGVNAKKIQAYVEWDEAARVYRLYAEDERAKFYITNATHGGLCGIVCRIGKGGKEMGLFIVELPQGNIDADGVFFKLSSSGAGAFTENWNSRLEFRAFPIPERNRIGADGVEVLFYCLRMGRCMLAAMSAGYQKMFAADSLAYARARSGVGGLVISHELPQLNLAMMMAGAFTAQALSHLSLLQDAKGIDLAGLRDITKTMASGTARSSLEAAEKVIGGRSFDVNSRVHQARHNMHVFGIVEGQDDLILMGMVKDVTSRFTDRYLAPLLSTLRGRLRLSLRDPAEAIKATLRLLTNPGFWSLTGWVASQGLRDLARLPLRLVPAWGFRRYRDIPESLRPYARWAEEELARQKWVYLLMNGYYQLELTKAQLPLLLFGRRIEKLVALLAVCFHAESKDDEHSVAVARLAVETLKREAEAIKVVRAIPSIERIREASSQAVKTAEGSYPKPAPIPNHWNRSGS